MATVLLVDDQMATRTRLRDLLLSRGYSVEEASDGQSAAKVLLRAPVDAIVLDLIMPGMSGWEFRELQLGDERFAAIPTLILTVQPLQDHDRYALKIGASTVMQKPFEDAEVLEAIARLVAS